MPLKILHIAPFNTSDVPMTLVRAERALGHTSRLITLSRDRRGYEEDICLELPFLDFVGTRFIKKIVSHPDKLNVDSVAHVPKKIPHEWHPNGIVEKILVRFREQLWSKKVNKVIAEYNLNKYDVYQLDSGLEFTRDGRFIKERKREGKKIICCYNGSDLRTRGVLPNIDKNSDLNVTVEIDHVHLHPDIHHVFFPFELERFKTLPTIEREHLKIGHAPTNRKAKKSDIIIPIIQSLSAEYNIELVLIENLPFNEAINRKSQCDIFVDQLGDLGYGINSLEALAMAIPTCSCLAAGFTKICPDHPFIEVNENNLRDKLIHLINNFELRRTLSKKGRKWLEKYHDSRQVVKKIHKLAGL